MAIGSLVQNMCCVAVVGTVIFLGASVTDTHAQGFGDFSSPAPERKPPKKRKTTPTRRSTKKTSRKPRAPSREEYTWISGRRICSGTGQTCNKRATWPFENPRKGTYYLDVFIPTKYCSPMAISVNLDGTNVGKTEWLSPGDSGPITLGLMEPGSHSIRMTAIGKEGGCNTGSLENWGVDLTLTNRPPKPRTSSEPETSATNPGIQ